MSASEAKRLCQRSRMSASGLTFRHRKLLLDSRAGIVRWTSAAQVRAPRGAQTMKNSACRRAMPAANAISDGEADRPSSALAPVACNARTCGAWPMSNPGCLGRAPQLPGSTVDEEPGFTERRGRGSRTTRVARPGSRGCWRDPPAEPKDDDHKHSCAFNLCSALDGHETGVQMCIAKGRRKDRFVARS